MTPDDLVAETLRVAEAGLDNGEQPIGAVVEADEQLGRRKRPHPLRLAVNLEPCVMCLGAAV